MRGVVMKVLRSEELRWRSCYARAVRRRCFEKKSFLKKVLQNKEFVVPLSSQWALRVVKTR